MNATLAGGNNLRGHNILKNSLSSLFRYCGILSEVEPYGVLGNLVPQQPHNRVNAFRAAQTIIPNIRSELPDTVGGLRREYVEVKTVSSSPSGITRPRVPVRWRSGRWRLAPSTGRPPSQLTSGTTTWRKDPSASGSPHSSSPAPALGGLVNVRTRSSSWWPSWPRPEWSSRPWPGAGYKNTF